MDEQSIQPKSDFASYPFPKNLKIAVKQGCYRIYNAEGPEFEDIEAPNAKDALTMTKFNKVDRILYLGFIDKSILTKSDILNEQTASETTEETK